MSSYLKFRIQFITLTMKHLKVFYLLWMESSLSTSSLSVLSSSLREPNGEVEHREYLHKDSLNPMPSLIESLKANVGSEGSILVWYESMKNSK